VKRGRWDKWQRKGGVGVRVKLDVRGRRRKRRGLAPPWQPAGPPCRVRQPANR
jgi:hypothetical protein